MTAVSSRAPIVVVGAGLAGLACARALAEAGHACVVLESADGIGGRVRTDLVEGFRLDRGFQVFFTAYPEAQRVLDYPRLKLHLFAPGALVRVEGRFWRVVDPYRAPLRALAGVGAPIGTLGDKWRVLALRRRALGLALDEIFRAPERTTRDELAALGFTDGFVDRFFRPLLGGIFLDPTLSTTSRMLYFVYKMLASGDTTLPEDGMQAIPAQLAAGLPPGTVRVNTRVCGIRRSGDGVAGVALDDGSEVPASAVVVATDVTQAAVLAGTGPPRAPRAVACLYFAAPESPVSGPWLVLDGEGRGPVVNFCVPSQVAPGYAPAGQHLLSATVIGTPGTSDPDLQREVLAQLGSWFGADAVSRWRHLRTYRIPRAQSDQSPGWLEPAERPVRWAPGLYVCGDHVENASINGALHAGRRAAAAVAAEVGAR